MVEDLMNKWPINIKKSFHDWDHKKRPFKKKQIYF